MIIKERCEKVRRVVSAKEGGVGVDVLEVEAEEPKDKGSKTVVDNVDSVILIVVNNNILSTTHTSVVTSLDSGVMSSFASTSPNLPCNQPRSARSAVLSSAARISPATVNPTEGFHSMSIFNIRERNFERALMEVWSKEVVRARSSTANGEVGC